MSKKKQADCIKGNGKHLCLCPVCVVEDNKQKAVNKMLGKLDQTFVTHSELASQIAVLVQQYLLANPPGLTEAEVNTLIQNYLLNNPQGLNITQTTQVNNLIQQYIQNNPTQIASWIGSVALVPGTTYYSYNPTTLVQDQLTVSNAVDNSGGVISLNADGTFTINDSGIYAMGITADYSAINTGSGGGVGIGVYGGVGGTTFMGLGMIGMTAAVTNPMELLPPITGPAIFNLKMFTGQIQMMVASGVNNAVWLTIIKIA